MTDAVRSTCPYCGVGCGVRAAVGQGGAWRVAGDPLHPANAGRLCSKGSALEETLGLDGRLLFPTVRGRRTDWDTAIAAVADGFLRVVDRHGPDAVAFYVSGQLLTEDYYVANKLMKGFIGSANIDTNSRLCMASSVAGHRRAFGEDVVPGCYDDLEQADLVVLTGSNLAWCHPILYQRLVRARAERGTRVVVIDPRHTATADIADLHLAIRSRSDVNLFNGLLAHLVRSDAIDRSFVARHTQGFEAAAAAAGSPDIETVARLCNVPAASVRLFFEWFAAIPRTVTVYSQGVNQSSRGTDTVNAIVNCHLATGRIGLPGSGPFSVTGQPNAMGGREVGGLANQLAAHMDFDDPDDVDRVRRFWNAPRIATRPGPKAVDLFRAVGEGRIKALWIMATNPAVSLPDATAVRAALGGDAFVVVSDCTAETDTAAYADILLPAATWGEKDGTVTNSERRISRQRAFLPLPGEARPDWWIVSRVAAAMGWPEAFAYRTPSEIFREHAALSAFENDGRRVFDLGGLAGLSDADYDRLTPVQWPVPAGGEGTPRLFADGRFATPDGRARFVPVAAHGPSVSGGAGRPLVLNTGRIRDQWHTMTRTGRVARLSQHSAEPFVAVHPVDADRHRLSQGGFAALETDWGRCVLRVVVTPDQMPGEVFVPMHWNDRFAADAAVNRLVNPVVDALSGQPDLKHTPVRVAAVAMAWQGFMLSRRPLVPEGVGYWSRSVLDGGILYRLAGDVLPRDPTAWAETLIGQDVRPHATMAAIEYHDPRRGHHRWARFDADRLEACLFVAFGDAVLPVPDAPVDLFGRDVLDPIARASLLSGRPPAGTETEGRTVCACFGVGITRLLSTIRDHGVTDAAEIGSLLKAGTNCGSCIPEIRELIGHVHHGKAA